MVAPTPVKFAYKSVIRRRQKNFFSILGITLGVALLAGVQISVDSITVEWQNMFLHSGGEREISIIGITNPFFNESIVEELQQANIDNIDGITGRMTLTSTVFWEEEGTIETGITFEGVDSNEDATFGDYTTKEGSTIDISAIPDGNIIIGRELVELMETKENILEKGDSVEISVSLGSFVVVSQPMEIFEIYEDKGRGEENFANNIVVSLDWLQTQIQPFFSQVPGVDSANLINFIYCSLDKEVSDNADVSDEVIINIFNTLENSVGITMPLQHFIIINTRITTSNMVAAMMNNLGQILWIFGSIIIFCGLLLITNINLMTVEEREAQTGIMRAIGTKKRQVLGSYVTEFITLGFLGGFLGIFGGILYGMFLVLMFGNVFGLSAGWPVVTPQAIIIAFVAGFIVSLVTGILPAIRASNVNIVQVIRGIIPLKEKESSRKGLYGGIIMLLIGSFLLGTYDVNILEGQEAFRQASDIEFFFMPILLIAIGLTLVLVFFARKLIEIPEKLALQIISLILVIWPIINVLVLMDWAIENTGGMMLIFFAIFSLIIGSTMLVGINLDLVANTGEFIVGQSKRLKTVALLAFRQIAAQKTRSTLTFAIFASVLTLNIFIGTFSYSFRYGFDSQVNESSAEIDLMALADQDINQTINYADLVKESTTIAGSSEIEFGAGMTLTEEAFAFTEEPGESIPFDDPDKYVQAAVVDINTTDMWDNNELIFPFPLERKKMGDFDPTDDAELTMQENEQAWQGVANNSYVDDDGKIITSGGKPVIITALYTQDPMGMEIGEPPAGKSLWLLNSTGNGLIEFKVIAHFLQNPVSDYKMMGSTSPGSQFVFFVSSEWTSSLYAFTQNNQNGTENLFLFKTSHFLKSESNFNLASDIESWSNADDKDFRLLHSNNRLHGIEVIPVWDIYETQLEFMYDFMTFLTSFTSMGFIVGVMGLLVVSIRSVSERKREIGMMQSIGLTRFGVIIAVVIELITMGLIGLAIGVFNGIILGYGLINVAGEGNAAFLIPWNIIAGYTAITLGAAFIAAIIPGWRAQRIPPSEALRYTG
jgi:ABC-type antimicrobial peptide transport system permease subunit